MSNYPKIYSLSTAGVRQHNNADYLFHPIRTDFTGDNGLGKSIIADLMQLIFIPRRDMWKPGTEGVATNERRIDGIPLNKEYVQHAYTFINVERYQGRFIVAGVYIPKNSRIPVRPFIIQKGEDFDEGKTLISFEHPLKATDFLSEDKHVLELKDLKEHLKAKYGLTLRDFFRADDINFYYELLYKNQILPIDLTKETNLKAFAKILQSFARAKTLDINNSRSLQNFLFEDNYEIKSLFEEQKDLLVSYIRQYNTNRGIIKDLEYKQTKLLALKKQLDKSNEAKLEYYKGDAVFASGRLRDTQRASNENKQRLDKAMKTFQENSASVKRLSQNILSNYYEVKGASSILKKMYEELLPQFTDEKINEKREIANRLWSVVNELDKVAPIYKKYKSVKAIQHKLKEQEVMKEKKKLLTKLKAINSFSDFEKTEWAKNYQKAYDNYQSQLSELPQTIEHLKSTLELYEGEKKDSLLHWAISQKKALTVQEETVVMHFKEVMLKKGPYEEGSRFTLNPKKLMESYEPNGEGLWLHLGELREYVPYVKEQKFNNAKTLKTALEKDKNEIKASLAETQLELEVITRINRELSEIGYNTELCAIYKEREEIQRYEIDEELNESVIPVIQNNIDNLDRYDEIRQEYMDANEQATYLAKRQTEIDMGLEEAHHDISDYTAKIEEFERETKISFGFDDMHLKRLSLEQLKADRDTTVKENEKLLAEKETAERSIISSEGIISSCREREKQINENLEKYQKDFDEKRRTLELETELKFDDVMQLGGYTENMIRRLEFAFLDARRDYEEEFTRIAQSFDETKDHSNPELENDKYNFFTLVRILCGKMGLEGLSPELDKLNEELKKFGDLQLAIIMNVFSQVEKQFNGLKRLVTELNFFFQENKISHGYHFRIDFNERKDIDISWITKMRERAKVQRFGSDLFTEVSGIHHADNSPDKLIISIAQQFSSIKSCELEDLLNPKFYFDLKVGLFDDSNNRYSGSGGQAYTALALLCIGRLSVIQREKNRPGVKFIIIEELSNIDDTNFGLFPQIAEQFGYQLLTMTPKPFGTYTEDSWFLHMLVRGKDKDINYQPMSFFKTKNSKKMLQDYIAEVN